MHNKMQKKVIVASLATVFLVVGCNGGSSTSANNATSTRTASTISPIAAQTVAATQKVELINDLSKTPLNFSTTKIGATDTHSFKFTNTTGNRVFKTILKIDNPNFTISNGFSKMPDGTFLNTSFLAVDQSINFSVNYTGQAITPTAQTAVITVEYYLINDKGSMLATPGTAAFPVQYQTTNGPAIITPSTQTVVFREVLANNNDFDSYLFNLTNDSETPSGKIAFNTTAPFSVESTTCTTLAPHESCSIKVDFGKTVTVDPSNKADLEIKYFAENGNINVRTAKVALAGATVAADKVYVKLESAVAGGRLFGGDGSTTTPYNVEVGGSPLNLQLTYRNTGSFVVDGFSVNTAKLPAGYTLVKNDCANVSLPTNATCTVNLNAASRKVGTENLNLATIPASWAGHDAAAIAYAGNNTINVNIHPKSSYQLETELPVGAGVKGYMPWERQPGKTRYFTHDDMIKIYASGSNLDSSLLDLRIDPKSLPLGMECAGGDDENGDSCKAIMTETYKGITTAWLGLVMDRSVPGGVYHIKATSQGRNIAADIMVMGYWQVGNAPAGTEITGLAAANNNVYTVAANNSKIFYNNGVVSPKGTHNWSATKGVVNMSKLAINDGNLCLVSNGKNLYSSANISKGVQGLTQNFSVDKDINSVACLSGENRSLVASGSDVYYYDGAAKTPQALASALQPITAMVANGSKVYFADNSKTIYTALNSYNPNAPKVSAIPQTGTDIQGVQYWPNYSWLLALSTDKTKLFSQVLNKSSSLVKLWSNEEMQQSNQVIANWIYGSYIYRTSDDGATWNTDSRLGNPWALLFPNFLPTELVASNQFVWSFDNARLGGTMTPVPDTLTQCGWPTNKPTFLFPKQTDHDNYCTFVDSPTLYSISSKDHGVGSNYGYNHVAYDSTYNMMFYSDNQGNIFGMWAMVPEDKIVPYPGTPTYY